MSDLEKDPLKKPMSTIFKLLEFKNFFDRYLSKLGEKKVRSL